MEKRLIKRQEQKKRSLAQAGIKYDFDTVAYVSFVYILVTQLPDFYTEKEVQTYGRIVASCLPYTHYSATLGQES